MIEITMPQLSDTMSEGTLVKWHKAEGDKVKAGEELADVETDKAVMPMEAFEGGTLAVVLVKEGEKVPVGGTIAVLASSKENAADVKKQFTSGAAKAPAPVAAAASSAEAAVGISQASASSTATLEKAAEGEITESASVGHGATRQRPTAVPAVQHSNGDGHRLHVSPLAKRIAKDKGIDLSEVQGSGPNGRIVKQDVMDFTPAPPAKTPAEAPPMPAKPAAAPQPARVNRGEKQVVPLTKMRQAIAKGLQNSKQNIPHFYETIDVDVEDLSALRVRLNTQLEAEKIRLSIGDLISKAVAVALLKHPAVNAHYNEAKNEITRFGDVHLGFAVALPDGLIVPVLRNIDQMGLKEIRTRSADLIDRARAQRLKQDEMTGATFTVSNLGTYGVREFSAIINPPSVAILAVASAEKRAVVRDDQIVMRTMMTLTLSADHRAVDGAVAAEFLRTLKAMLQEPALMLA